MSLLVSLVLLPATLAAEAAPGGARSTAGWDPAHPVQIGANLGAWAGQHAAPGVGGDLSLRPTAGFGLDLFWNSFASVQQPWLWHDHVIGFSLFAPSLLGSEGWFLAPTFGSCVDFRFQSPMAAGAPRASDVGFGVHGGGMLELHLGGPVSLEVESMATLYLDNGAMAEEWRVTASDRVRTRWVGQGTVGLSVAL